MSNVVAFRPSDEDEPSFGHIPDFEGKPVEGGTRIKLGSTANLPIDNEVYRHDDLLKFEVEVRVTGINHLVNAHGKLERIHTAKVLEITAVPWEQA